MRNSLPKAAQLTFLITALFAFLGTDQDARFQTLGHKVMCVCSCNQVLLECNHVGCAYSDRMRGELASYVDRGDSDDLTLQALVQKYGPTVLIAPTTTGFNRVAWVMPYLVLVLGLTTVVLIVRTWRTRPQIIPASGGERVGNAELERYREQARKDTEL